MLFITFVNASTRNTDATWQLQCSSRQQVQTLIYFWSPIPEPLFNYLGDLITLGFKGYLFLFDMFDLKHCIHMIFILVAIFIFSQSCLIFFYRTGWFRAQPDAHGLQKKDNSAMIFTNVWLILSQINNQCKFPKYKFLFLYKRLF